MRGEEGYLVTGSTTGKGTQYSHPPVFGNKHEFKQRNGSVARAGEIGTASWPVQPQTEQTSSALQGQEQTLRLSFPFGEIVCAGN